MKLFITYVSKRNPNYEFSALNVVVKGFLKLISDSKQHTATTKTTARLHGSPQRGVWRHEKSHKPTTTMCFKQYSRCCATINMTIQAYVLLSTTFYRCSCYDLKY